MSHMTYIIMMKVCKKIVVYEFNAALSLDMLSTLLVSTDIYLVLLTCKGR